MKREKRWTTTDQQDTGGILTFHGNFFDGQPAHAKLESSDQAEASSEPKTFDYQPDFLRKGHIEPPEISNATKAMEGTLTKGRTFAKINHTKSLRS